MDTKPEVEGPYTQALRSWFEAEKKNGVVDLKISFSGDDTVTVESLSREIIEILNAPPLPFDECKRL